MKKILVYCAVAVMTLTLAHLYSRNNTTHFLFTLAEHLKKYNLPKKQKTLIFRRTAGALALYRKELNQWSRYSQTVQKT